MSDNTPPIPDELRARLREESAEERADLEAVWALLGTVDEAADEAPDPETAWVALARRHPELDAPPTDGQATPDADRATDRIVSRRRQRSAQPSRREHRQKWAPRAVGMVLAVLVLVGGLWWWQRPVTVTAPVAQQRTATLPDGSTVELNSSTTISYRRGFQTWPFADADRRTVRLDGEAFFEVTEEARPFTIETTNAQVTVVGTRFNVRARNEEGRTTEVTVVRGRVQVAPRQRPEESVLLSEPGQTSRVADSKLSPTAPQSTNIDHVLAWRDDGFAVRAQPLSAVLHELERRYDATIQLHPSVDRRKAPVSLYYPDPTTLETILHDLCTARDLNYRSTSRGFEVFAGSADDS